MVTSFYHVPVAKSGACHEKKSLGHTKWRRFWPNTVAILAQALGPTSASSRRPVPALAMAFPLPQAQNMMEKMWAELQAQREVWALNQSKLVACQQKDGSGDWRVVKAGQPCGYPMLAEQGSRLKRRGRKFLRSSWNSATEKTRPMNIHGGITAVLTEIFFFFLGVLGGNHLQMGTAVGLATGERSLQKCKLLLGLAEGEGRGCDHWSVVQLEGRPDRHRGGNA